MEETEDYNFLRSFHQRIEDYLCKREDITEERVAQFKYHFEEMRDAFPDLVGEMDSGDHENAPYHKQHLIASRMEKWLCDQMLGDGGWEKYQEFLKTV